MRSTLARTSRSATSRSTRSPAREASAASSSAASIAWSSLGWSPTRPAEVRPGVQHDQHVPVPLGPPGADHDGGRPGGAPPVDGADVVAGHVLAQAVELGALAALQDGGPAVQLAQPGQPAGQVLAGVERRQGADGPRRARARPAARPRRSGPSARMTTGPGPPVTAPGRPQGQFAGAVAAGPGSGTRCTPPRAPADGVQASRTVAVEVAAAECWSAAARCAPPRRAGPRCRRPGGPGPWPARRRAAMSSRRSPRPAPRSRSARPTRRRRSPPRPARRQRGQQRRPARSGLIRRRVDARPRAIISGAPGRWPGSTRSPSRW